VAESVSRRILPLPMYPELTDAQVDHVIAVVRGFEV
jgi:dTDP-4-amino-4,6-dideoxygalactose transaminase